VTDRIYVSRDCDGLTKLWRHEPLKAEGQTGVFYHGCTVEPLVVVTDATAFPKLGLGQCGPLELPEDKITGDGEPRKPGKGDW
jgi:hypothetical protein